MRFQSTRGGAPEVSFREAIFRGLAPDGGLYHPSEAPRLEKVFAELMEHTAAGASAQEVFLEVAERVSLALFEDELGTEEVRSIVRRAFSFAPRLQEVAPRRWLLELFHGPSYAFKDFGASFLAASMESLIAERKKQTVVLVATSGDTGSAVARAFHGRENIEVVILYPSGRVSRLQEMQLTTLGGNITALEVRGSFDDCQRMVKEAFLDPKLGEALTLTSANSISLGRLIPQAFYYVFAAVRLAARAGAPVFCVPSGNFGNLTAGVYAWQWGLPVRRFVAATNVNDVVPEYLDTGLFSPRPSVHTLSNAMDVGNPSNFERLLAIFDRDAERMADRIHGEAVTDQQTIATIRAARRDHGLVLDPHTAVGWEAARRFCDAYPGFDGDIVILATAHPAKFVETIREALGEEPPLPGGLQEALSGEKQSTVVENTLESLKRELLGLV